MTSIEMKAQICLLLLTAIVLVTCMNATEYTVANLATTTKKPLDNATISDDDDDDDDDELDGAEWGEKDNIKSHSAAWNETMEDGDDEDLHGAFWGQKGYKKW
ncbi:unnamed protein product [Dibothriocephalus latus]|uniref:Uncharacterized protein n=1 Tax=Dibothriocephalus latus TaxID=60516 RepID=A0A3P7PCA8_DIBLA|nr:unnamed protein product [Dibothriocephalus latus]